MTTYRRNPLGDNLRILWNSIVHNRKFNRGAAWGAMIVGALFAFEIFNFSTTQYALHDMLGDLKFAGMRWSTVLAIAFCGIDFAGIARIFTPEQGRDEPAEVYYLFGAWVLAAGFNATLTWWGVSVAITTNGNLQSSAVMSAATLTKAVPVFVAVMVWLVRLLIIGTFSLAGDRLFTTAQVSQSQRIRSRNSNNTRLRARPTTTLNNSAPLHPIKLNHSVSRSTNLSISPSCGPHPRSTVLQTHRQPQPTSALHPNLSRHSSLPSFLLNQPITPSWKHAVPKAAANDATTRNK